MAADLIDELAAAGELPPVEPTSAEIRAWAVLNGYAISDRGRIPAELRRAYLAAR